MEKDSSPIDVLAQTLRRQSRLLERVQRIAQIGGWELDLCTNELTWTDETYRIHGVTRDTYQPTVETAIGFYTPETQPIIRKALHAATRRALHWVRATGLRQDAEGEPHILCGVFQDVTDRRVLEQEILYVGQRERTLLGFDLHDGLGQELTGALFMLGGVLGKL